MSGLPAPENDRLEQLRREIALCRICCDRPQGGEAHRLPHEPRPVVVLSGSARILIAGQAPGLKVHETGLPFNDASGDRLRQWMGVDRDAFYDPARFAIVPMGFCFPGYNRQGHDLPPRRECAPAWRDRVLAAMPQVELVLAVGQYAQAWHLGHRRKRTLGDTVRHWQDYFHGAEPHTPKILPLPHPSWRNTAWLRINPWFEQELLPVLQEEVDRLSPSNL